MNKKRLTWLIVGSVLLLITIYLITTYNSLVKKEEKVKLQWNEVQNAYQRRLDLIPSLVNVVKGTAEYEQRVLTKIAEARSKIARLNVDGNVTSAQYNQQLAAQNELAAATNNLILSVEKYPELQGTNAFANLQTDLVGTERRIKVARKDFNAAIQQYNSTVRSFPTNAAAGILGFKHKEGFIADTGNDKATEIKF